MVMTICAILIALLMGFFTPVVIDFDALYLTIIMLVGGTSTFLAAVFLNTMVLIPLERLEQKLIPNLMELVRRDRPLALGRFYLFLFSLVSMICVAFVSRIQEVKYQDWFFLGWLVFFGGALDVLRDSWKRCLNFLNPSFLVSRVSNEAITAIQNDEDPLFWNSLDSLGEIGLQAVEKSKIALSTQALQAFPPITQSYFSSSKSISHTGRDLAAKGSTGDEASYMIFYLLQRLELINDRALRDRVETVCRQMVMTMGKIITHCAQFDLSMVSFPTHFLTKFGLKAQQHHFDEVGVLTTSTLLEIAKTILTSIDITYAELQDPFRSIINGLSALAKGTFKKRKDTSIKVLVQPLIDLKAMFQTEKMAHHRDTPAIMQEIDRILEEFIILEQVMQTLPPMPEFGETKEFSPGP
jgi:hypothetical protein